MSCGNEGVRSTLLADSCSKNGVTKMKPDVGAEVTFKKIEMAGWVLRMVRMQTDLFQSKEGDCVRF
jgi:hypothetical protein